MLEIEILHQIYKRLLEFYQIVLQIHLINFFLHSKIIQKEYMLY